MAKGMLRQGVEKFRGLRPGQVRQAAGRAFRIELIGGHAEDRDRLLEFFAPVDLSPEERAVAMAALAEAGEAKAEIRVMTPAAAAMPHLVTAGTAPVVLDPEAPKAGLTELFRAHPDYRLALAQTFPRLREPLARELIRAAAARNAGLAALSALPEVIPSPLSVVLAIGEMGSDTVLLTAVQIGLSFELAAVRGAPVGWVAQRGAILGIMAGALGWRSLARGLVSMIPAGVGLAAKSAIAFSGTMAVGAALWRIPPPSTAAAGARTRPRPLPLAAKRQRA